MSIELLPMPFIWQDYLDWAERRHPDVTYNEACNTFEYCKRIGMIREEGVRDDGEVMYGPGIRHPKRMLILVKDEAHRYKDYKPERDT